VAIESATSSPGNQVIWTLPLTTPDKYDVYARWGSNDSGASTAKYVVTHAGGTDTVTMDQNLDAGFWKKLGTYDLAPGAGHKVNLSDRTNGVVQADAIRLTSAEGIERIARWQGTVTNAGSYQVWARWPAAPTHTFAASYDIITPAGTQTAIVNQRIEGGRWHLLKTISLAANDNWSVELSDQSPGEVVADAVAITSPLNLTDRFDWSPTFPSAGEYAVYAKWQAAEDRAIDATYEVTHSGGVDEVTVDQRHNGGEWRYLGTWNFDPSQSPKVSLLASLNGTVNADAVRFVSGDAVGGDIAYSHTDQIGTIQKLSDAGGTMVWDRIARPFGETVSINGLTGVGQALRFAGQYADETGLSYNYFRDYDPTLGRYLESDPIGLAGGVNTYAYVGGNPITRVDPTGEYWQMQLTWMAVNYVSCVIIHTLEQQAQFGCVDLGLAARESIICFAYLRWIPKWARVAVAGGRLGLSNRGGGKGGQVSPTTGSGGGGKGGSNKGGSGGKDKKTDEDGQPPLKRLHKDSTYEQGSAKGALEDQRRRSTEDIIDSLKPGQKEPLIVKEDGTVMQGNTRIKVLEERGIDVDKLPRTPHENLLYKPNRGT
jgi:RHS repeat-associated protein